ncbi:hypothetical protein LTR95_010262 [Oleoguttula sp. CCFEE 5521]
MADPLSVISAIASVIQLIDFSAKLLSRLNEYRTKGNELPASFTHIDRKLPLLREILERSKSGIECQNISDREVKAIIACLEGCGDQIEKLNNILAKIVPELQENAMKRMAKGLRSVWKESEVRDIDERIGGYVQTLNFYCTWSSSKLDSRNDETHAKLQTWLAAPDPYLNLRRALKLRTPATGNWYLRGDQYQNWKTGKHPFTWLYGAAGSGKSILSAGICRELEEDCSNDPAKTLAIWFFDFNDNAKQDPSNMLRSLVGQFLNGCAHIPASVQSLYATCEKSGRSPSADDLLLLLKHVLQTIPTPLIVLDALDECTNRASLFEIIEALHIWKISGVRILMTSRREIDIEEALEDFVPETAWTCLETDLVDKDIRTYVHERLTKDKSFRRWQGPNERDLRAEIETMLGQKANGMFRWAGCQLDVLAQCTTKGKVRRALKELPKTLDETYDRIVLGIESGENAQDAIKILTWLAYSERPLEIDELLEVTGIFLDDAPRFDRDEVLNDPRDVLRICSSLVSVTTIVESNYRYSIERDDQDLVETNAAYSLECDASDASHNDHYLGVEGVGTLPDNVHAVGEEDNISANVPEPSNRRQQHVRLAHFSVREYLASDRACIPQYCLGMIGSHDMLASSSLVYLLRNHPSPDIEVYSEVRSQDAPLFRYAADYWGIHARASGELSQLQRDLAMELLMMDMPIHRWGTRACKQGTFPDHGLCVASFLGLPRAVTRMLEDPSIDPDARCGRRSQALYVASEENHLDIVSILLDRGADINWRDRHQRTALFAATAADLPEIVQILLDRGADAYAREASDISVLWVASHLGHYKVVERLVKHDAHVQHTSQDQDALHIASQIGFASIVALLLEHGINVDSPNEDGETGLQAASRRGHSTIVKLLLARGADVNHTRSWRYGTALQAAFREALIEDESRHMMEEIVKILLDHGADPDMHGIFGVYSSGGLHYYYTALQAATGEGHEAAAQMLREKNAKSWPCCKANPKGGIICDNDPPGSDEESNPGTVSDEQCGDCDTAKAADLEIRSFDSAPQRLSAELSTMREDLTAISLGTERLTSSPNLVQGNQAEVVAETA